MKASMVRVNVEHSITMHFFFPKVLLADLLIYIPAVVLYCLYLTEGTAKKQVVSCPICFDSSKDFRVSQSRISFYVQ